MCTSVSVHMSRHYFGRNLDLEGSFGEGVVITPRAYHYKFRAAGERKISHAIIGMAFVQNSFPLYYDGLNEYGLCMAGLNFPKNAVYLPVKEGAVNVTPFEIIPYILGSCKSVKEAVLALKCVNVCDIPFSAELPLTPLHWMISDKEESVVLEPTEKGLKIYQNPVNVLTNNPPFPEQLENLKNYGQVTNAERDLNLPQSWRSRGSGAVGLPGDWSSPSRFVRAEFVARHLVAYTHPMGEVQAFFHLLASVAMPRGCVKLKEGVYEETVYSCCCDTSEKIYYYTTYSNPAPTAVKLFSSDLNGSAPQFFPLNNPTVN